MNTFIIGAINVNVNVNINMDMGVDMDTNRDRLLGFKKNARLSGIQSVRYWKEKT
jgi:hypothetical protein